MVCASWRARTIVGLVIATYVDVGLADSTANGRSR